MDQIFSQLSSQVSPLIGPLGQARAPLKPSQARDDAAKISVRLDPSARAGFYLRSSDLRSEMPKPLARRSRMMEHIAD